MIDRATIDRIMAAADIVDVVSEFVSLRKAGVNYKGLCPFHDEKTPSFVVAPAKGYCHCFSCGKGGNAVGFIMEHEQMTYPEALRWLARKYNIEIEERGMTDGERREAGERESMFIVNEWARGYFQENLINTGNGLSVGMQYLRSRGFRDDTISKFQLGYALPVRDALARAAVARGFKEQYLVDTGLCYRRDDGSLQDRYAGRVIFPVHTMTGRVVAFGGRILTSDKKAAKYVNSPESLIYHKGGELYGLYQARQAITRADRCYLVEGYVDVTSMHQCGVENVVASIDGGENFALDGGTSTFYYDALASKGEQSQTVPLQALPTAKSGAQAVTVQFKYEYVDAGKRTAATSEIRMAVPVVQKDRFQVSAPQPPESCTVGEECVLTLNYVNRGKVEVSNVEATVEGDGVDAAARTQFVGNIAAGASGNVGFALTPNRSGKLKVTLKISYEDPNLEARTLEFPVELSVAEEELPVDLDEPVEEEPGFRFPWPVLGLIPAAGLVAGAVVLLRRRSRKGAGKSADTNDWGTGAWDNNAWDGDEPEV